MTFCQRQTLTKHYMSHSFSSIIFSKKQAEPIGRLKCCPLYTNKYCLQSFV